MGRRTKVEAKLAQLQGLAEQNGAILHAICFRDGQVGIQWREDARAADWPYEPGLVVYGYYPTLTDAIEGEIERLQAKEAERQ
jgi:hypothetical protein